MWKAAGAFVRNTYFDLAQNKQEDRYSILLKVYEYLETTGIQQEIEAGLNDRLIGNLWALAEIQKLLPTRRQELLLSDRVDEPTTIATDLLIPTMKQAERFMKYSTAVYGPQMIAAVQQENLGTTNISETDDSLETCIVKHVGGDVLSVEDILVTNMEDGDSLECLRYAVTLDHEEKAVVLAIRGTLSLSSIYIDVAGFAEDYCGGQAHAGMAHMARAVWTHAQASVKSKLFEFPDGYSLVITGHSLGAGVACLISILLHDDESLLPPDIPVKCMAYAPPPVFYPLEAATQAVQHTTAYVHEYDVVPSLSCNALRRLMMAVVSYDKKELTTFERVRIEYGYDEPCKEIVSSVRQASQTTLPEQEGAPWLAIPAKCIVWLEDTASSDEENNSRKERMYSTVLLDPIRYSQRLIDLTDDMINDHYTSEYEAAFRSVISGEAAAQQAREEDVEMLQKETTKES